MTYRVKNTFIEVSDEEDDDQPVRVKRSNSWSQQSSSDHSSVTGSVSGSSSIRHGCEDAPDSGVTLDSPVQACARDVFLASRVRLAANLSKRSAQRTKDDDDDGVDDADYDRDDSGPGHIVFSSSSTSSAQAAANGRKTSKNNDKQKLQTFFDAHQLPAANRCISEGDVSGSEAALLHAQSNCIPCLRFILRDGCQRGDRCKHCHLPHIETRKPRPCRTIRHECKQLIQNIRDSSHDRDTRLEKLQMLISPQSPYMRSLLIHTIKDLEDPPPILYAAGPVTAASQCSSTSAAENACKPVPPESGKQVKPKRYEDAGSRSSKGFQQQRYKLSL
eukprot:TRINITY_DN107570_c0_g1_i1.p1 TRINITY_DN107570_c0_g1~~TRINITY_DN107570_c0_g1_i1.p1  ORF type:complete len:332 (-),score=64.03 TRINITY_DN107570_c0_g1_i1:104-1099(-)